MSDLEVPSAGEAASGLSQWQRVAYTFSAPSKTFEDIKRGHKSWWLPFILIAVTTYILFAAITFEVGWGQVVENTIRLNPKAEARLAQLTPEQRASADKATLYSIEGTFIASPVFTLAGVALFSLGLWGTINFVFGGKAKYGSILAVWFYASLPGIFKSLLGAIVLFAGGSAESFNLKNFAPTNVAAFVFPNPQEANKALYALASWLDVTTIWTLVLLGIGTATVAGLKRSSGYLAVFGWWVIFLLISVGWAAVAG
jgi:hypothetical protein